MTWNLVSMSERKTSMTSIKTLESIKNKLSPDEYNSIANDLVILAKIWYAVSKEDDNYFYIDKSRDTGEIAQFFKTKTVKTKKEV